MDKALMRLLTTKTNLLSRNGSNLWIAGGKICAVAGEQPHALRIPPGKDAKAVELDFVNPTGARRRLLRRARKARLKRGTLTRHNDGE